MVISGVYCGIILPHNRECNIISFNNLCAKISFANDCDIRHFLSNVVGEMQPAGLIGVIFIS